MTTHVGDRRSASRVELNGINVIAESERKGSPRDLFWPWFAANVSVLAISYGSFIVGFGVSFWQATIAAVVGIVLSFALCGVVALAGKRGSAPTMVLSRAPFGVKGNALPTFLSWVLLVGWETVLVSLAVARRPRRCSASSAGAAATRRRCSASSSPRRSWSAPASSASTSSCGCRPGSRSRPSS